MRFINRKALRNIGRSLTDRTFGFAVSLSLLICVSGCLPCGVFTRFYVLKAQVIDAVTGIGISDTRIGGSLFTQGEETSFREPSEVGGNLDLLPPDEEGQFELAFVGSDLGEACGTGAFQRIVREPEFPPPDRIELIVVRGACEQRFLIEVNEDTVVDLSFPNRTLELREPILVPSCAPQSESDGNND